MPCMGSPHTQISPFSTSPHVYSVLICLPFPAGCCSVGSRQITHSFCPHLRLMAALGLPNPAISPSLPICEQVIRLLLYSWIIVEPRNVRYVFLPVAFALLRGSARPDKRRLAACMCWNSHDAIRVPGIIRGGVKRLPRSYHRSQDITAVLLQGACTKTRGYDATGRKVLSISLLFGNLKTWSGSKAAWLKLGNKLWFPR